MLNRDARARRQPPPRATLRRSPFALRELRRQEAGLDDEGGGRLAIDGRGRRIELSLNENFSFPDQHRKLRGAFCFFRDGGEGEPIGIECQRE